MATSPPANKDGDPHAPLQKDGLFRLRLAFCFGASFSEVLTMDGGLLDVSLPTTSSPSNSMLLSAEADDLTLGGPEGAQNSVAELLSDESDMASSPSCAQGRRPLLVRYRRRGACSFLVGGGKGTRTPSRITMGLHSSGMLGCISGLLR
mmetsp:Transcript_81913/g.232201  ORF Transcript_81913/g.232201 Transcript_81913/m.232201 type:complete len:149 (-) Transcript_81913:1135-1581(-)